MTNERKLSTSDIAASDERRMERDRLERDRADLIDRDRMDGWDQPIGQVMDDRRSSPTRN